MDSMAQRYPALVSVTQFGTSTEGRPMKVMKISTAGPSSNRSAIWLDGGLLTILLNNLIDSVHTKYT